jgi:LysR family hydrogen peroxide-inducible transcriptional activator
MSAKPTLKQLKYLCTVAKTMHFGKAAKACHVTQSTLSSGIHELEQSLGITLLERNNKQVLLTDVGKNVVQRAQNILIEVDELVALAAAAVEPLSRPIRMGVIPTIAPFMLPNLLANLRKDYPKLQLLIREDLSENIIHLLQEGELDVLLLALPYPMENVTTRHLFHDPFLLAYPKGHPLSKTKPLKTSDLKGQDILLLEDGHCLRDHALEACKLSDSQINQPYTATSLHTIVQMVANGIGSTLLPKMALDAGILSGTAIVTKPFTEKHVWRSIGLAWRKSNPRAAEYELLADYIIQHR